MAVQGHVTPWILLLIGISASSLITVATSNKLVPSCPPEVKWCEFTFTLSHNYTMMKFTNGDLGQMLPVKVTENGSFYFRDGHCATWHLMNGNGKVKVASTALFIMFRFTM